MKDGRSGVTIVILRRETSSLPKTWPAFHLSGRLVSVASVRFSPLGSDGSARTRYGKRPARCRHKVGLLGPALICRYESAHLRQLQLARSTPPRFPGGHRRPELLVEPEPTPVEVVRLADRRQ